MLVEFSLENFRSIKDEARLSMVAGPGREHRDTHVTEAETGGRHPIALLHCAALYGANAAGKTNILAGLHAMRRIVSRSIGRLDSLPVVPFRFDGASRVKPTTFEVTCIVDGIRYQYGFAATGEVITGEWLYAWPRGRAQLWFDRDGEGRIKFGDKLTGDKEVWRRATRPDALFLATAIALNNTQMRPLFDWFSNTLHIAGIGGWGDAFSMAWCKDERRADIVDFLQEVDFAVADVRVVEEEFSTEMLPQDMPSELKEAVREDMQGATIQQLKVKHESSTGEPVELDLGEESDGTQKVFALAGPWLHALRNGHIIVFDELHDNLHPTLVRYLIRLFHDPQWNKHGAQLVFTTHDTSILDQEFLRRDQVWFCERSTDQATQLVPLSDYHPRKGVENLESSYLAGRYGGLPYVGRWRQDYGNP